MRQRRLLRVALVLAIAVWTNSCGSPTAPDVPGPQIACPPAPDSVQSISGQPVAVGYGAANSTGGAAPVTVTCTPSSGSLFAVGSTNVTCTATDAKSRASMCTFAVTVTTPPRLAATRFIAFGDSITCGEAGTDAPVCSSAAAAARAGSHPLSQVPSGDTYPDVLQQKLTARYAAQTPSVANAGLSGEGIVADNSPARLATLLSRGQFDVLLLMEGSNDIDSGTNSGVVPAAISGLRQMVDNAKGRGMRTYLATIPPENGLACCPRRGNGGATVQALNDQIRQLASSEGVTLVDVYEGLNADIGTYIGFDGLHPTIAGYAKIADLFLAAIKQTMEAPLVLLNVRQPGAMFGAQGSRLTAQGAATAGR